jgi:hypothetical protein
MARCERDAECRTAEGYVCDAVWKACVMPNATAIVPRTCPAARGIGRDLAFAPTTAVVDANQSASAIASDGRVVTVHAALFGPDARDPALAHAGGVWFAAWSAGAVMFATSRDGARWSTPVKLDDNAGRPSVIAGAGAVHVMFAHEGLRVRTSRDGGKTFDAPRTIVAGGYGNATLGADGRLHVAAIDGSPLGAYGSANQRIQYANGGKPVTVSRRDEVLPFYFSNPSVAVDARRKWIYVAYVRGGRDARWDLVLAASKDGGATWSRTRIGDDPPCAIHMVPNLALDPRTGTLHVAWYDSRGEQPRFAHATCKPGLVGCLQVGRINDVPFATLQAVRGNATWIGESATLLVDDKRRTLHAVWTQPVDDGGKIVARVFHAKAKLPLR